MRVTWVHPSWRDLVIEHLSADGEARRRFLRSCSAHGALLALSSAGGASGQRQTPLLQEDRDWDALTDRLFELAPDLEQAELIGVLDALRLAIEHETRALDTAEAHALSRALLDRVAAVWRASGRPIDLRALEAWLILAARVRPRPALPQLGVTWAELLPAAPPDLADRAGLERFVDWLTLAELVLAYDGTELTDLGFPGRSPEHCDAFLTALEDQVRVADADQVTRALRRITVVVPPLAERAEVLRIDIASRALATRWDEPQHADWPRRRERSNDVARVLKDL